MLNILVPKAAEAVSQDEPLPNQILPGYKTGPEQELLLAHPNFGAYENTYHYAIHPILIKSRLDSASHKM